MTRSMTPAYLKAGQQLFRSLNTPVALSCYIMTKYAAWDELVSKDVSPHSYLDCSAGVNLYRRDKQAASFFRKSRDVPASVDRRKAAVEKFYECETKCAEVNYFLEHLQLQDTTESPTLISLRNTLSDAKKIVARILGRLPDSLSEWGRYGPGTSFELKGSAYTTLMDKLHTIPGVTQAALPVWIHTCSDHHWYRTRLGLGLSHHQVVRGNRFTTVPKTALTDRGICIEPLGNLYCQLAVGSFLKERLAAVGLFVNRGERPRGPIEQLVSRPRPNGQELHQQIAAKASLDRSWATIDLSDASDTVCRQLVRYLLPDEWFTLLDSLRSPRTLVKGKWHLLSKFSSMGNGFTFELETLLFSAISSAVVGGRPGKDVLVYGDDILVATDEAENVMAYLRQFGFTPNLKKSFHTGHFRESCGGDFFCGFDVRPYFSEAEPSNPLEWIALHNQLRKKWPSFKHVHRHVVEQVPKRFRVFGPSRIGDSVLHSDHRTKWVIRLKDGIHWLRCVSVRPIHLPVDRWSEGFTLSSSFHGVRPEVGLPVRGSFTLGHQWSSCS